MSALTPHGNLVTNLVIEDDVRTSSLPLPLFTFDVKSPALSFSSSPSHYGVIRPVPPSIPPPTPPNLTTADIQRDNYYSKSPLKIDCNNNNDAPPTSNLTLHDEILPIEPIPVLTRPVCPAVHTARAFAAEKLFQTLNLDSSCPSMKPLCSSTQRPAPPIPSPDYSVMDHPVALSSSNDHVSIRVPGSSEDDESRSDESVVEEEEQEATYFFTFDVKEATETEEGAVSSDLQEKTPHSVTIDVSTAKTVDDHSDGLRGFKRLMKPVCLCFYCSLLVRCSFLMYVRTMFFCMAPPFSGSLF